MKISDEIRRWCDETAPWPTRADARAIADRIDREMVELPKDADGEVIHAGDTVFECDSGIEKTVYELRIDADKWWLSVCGGRLYAASEVTHERPDSFERIADDIERAEGWCDREGGYGTGISSVKKSTLREWADRIRKLAKEGER